jgi:HEAT repeat protein
MPAIVRRWAADPQAAARPRLEQVVVACGRQGRDVLRRVLASADEATDVRVAAIRLLELIPGTDHLPALEAALSDREDAVRREAFGALANSSSNRAFDILARGIARSDAASQAALLDRLASLGGVRMLPVLQRLFPKVDPRTVAVPVYLSMIGALKRAGTAADAALLTAVFERTPWSAPLRAWRFRAAARSALRAMRGQTAASSRGASPAAADAANAPSNDGGTAR